MKKVKTVCQHVFFYILLFLAVGQLPSFVGVCLLYAAILAAPYQPVRKFVDFLLADFSKRGICIVFILLLIRVQPPDVILEGGKCLGLFLNRLLRFFGLLP